MVVLATFVAFLPALNNGFLNWDDEAILLANSEYRGLGWTHLKWMFTTFHHSLYRPLTWITWGIDYLIWGTNPFGYHLASLVFHCANAVAFYFVAMRLLRLSMPDLNGAEYPGRVCAGLAALLFSIHPLRVEPVAWASGRENVVAGLFFVLAILFYLKAVEPSGNLWRYRIWMASSLAVFCLSLLGKASGMTFPLALLILDVYPLRRLQPNPRDWFQRDGLTIWREKVPFVVFGVAAGAIGWWAKHQIGGMTTWQDYGLVPRTAQSIYGLAFYPWKTLIPLHLSPLYELPQEIMNWRWTILGCGILLGLATTALLLLRNSYPAALASWLYYIVIVSPTLGLSQSGPQIAADRYTYLSCLAWPVLVGGGIYRYWTWERGRKAKDGISLAPALALILTAFLGVLSWRQSFVWRDSETLWRYTLSLGPSITAHYHLALLLDKRGAVEEAMEHYRRALEIKPDSAEARSGLAQALVRREKFAEAVEHYRRVLQIRPDDSATHVNLANALVAQGRAQEALQHYQQAAAIDPANGNAYFNLGNMFARMGQAEKARQSYSDAVRVQPGHSDAHFSLANALVNQGRIDEAVPHYQAAMKYRPDFAEAYHNLGRVLAAQGQLEKAIDHFRQALAIQPDFAEAHASLSQALAEQGRTDEAFWHHREAVRIFKLRQKPSAP